MNKLIIYFLSLELSSKRPTKEDPDKVLLFSSIYPETGRCGYLLRDGLGSAGVRRSGYRRRWGRGQHLEYGSTLRY